MEYLYIYIPLHLQGHHGLSTAEYKQKHGEPVFRDKVLHVCKTCQKTIIYNRGATAYSSDVVVVVHGVLCLLIILLYVQEVVTRFIQYVSI